MGSKKHKRHKSEKKVIVEPAERVDKPLKLVLKVSGSSSSLQPPPSHPAVAQSAPVSAPPASPSPHPVDSQQTAHHSSQLPQPAQQQQQQQHVTSLQPVVPQAQYAQLPTASSSKQAEVSMDWHSHDKHKKSKKKKKKKSSEKDKEKKHKHHHHHHHHHHYHHHHHREYSHERKDKKKRDHGSIHDNFECQDIDHEFVAKKALLDEGTPCERPFREPRACTLRKKAEKTPLQHLLYYLLKTLQKRDPQEFFAWPVNDIIAPGYSSIIQHPMDFSTMRKKIDDKEYMSVLEFRADLKLMCDNAMTYNRPDTVYYKAAKKMWHVGQKLLHKEHLLSIARTLPYVSELGIDELGFSLSEAEGNGHTHEEMTYDENRSILESKLKVKQSLQELDDMEDTMAANEILMQARAAAKAAADKLTLKKPNSKFGFLRQRDDGSTTLSILNPDTGTPSNKRELKVTLDMLTGKLVQGTGSITGFSEDPKNTVKPIHYLNYGAYCSYAPVYDSTFTHLSKEESDLVYSTYGDELGVQYADSLTTFAKDCDYVMDMVDRILDVLTWGEHSKTTAVLEEKRLLKEEDQKLQEEREKNLSNQSIYSDGSASAYGPLSNFDQFGIGDPNYDENESQYSGGDSMPPNLEIQEKLDETAKLLKSLTRVQHERLSRTPPVHLAHVTGPTKEERQLAEKVTNQLTELTSQVPPSAVATIESVRNAMGISVHPVQPVRSLSTEDFSAALTSTSSLGPSPVPSDVEDVSQDDVVSTTIQKLKASGHRSPLVLPEEDLDPDLHAFLHTGTAMAPIESPLQN